MDLADVIGLLSVVFVGLLAGMEFALHYGVRSPAEVLDERSQLQLRQALVNRLRFLVPAFFVPAAVFAVAGTLLDTGSPGEWLRVAGVLALTAWIGIRVIATVPINSATLTWNLDAPPEDWKAKVNHAERFHDLGVWLVVFAFASFVVALAL